MEILAAVSLGVITYLLGGVPNAYLLGRRRGADIRKLGTGNVGAANAAALFGWRAGAVVLFADVAKGGAAMLLVQPFHPASWVTLVVALAVIAGHNWSPYIRWAGGRGLATAIGISLVVVPLISLLGLAIGLAWYLITRRLLQVLVGRRARPGGVCVHQCSRVAHATTGIYLADVRGYFRTGTGHPPGQEQIS